jgi:hypothetical protein
MTTQMDTTGWCEIDCDWVAAADCKAYVQWCYDNLKLNDWYMQGLYFPIFKFKNEIDFLAFRLKFGI